MDKKEAATILEDILNILVEVGNGTTHEELHEAADLLFDFRDHYFKYSDILDE